MADEPEQDDAAAFVERLQDDARAPATDLARHLRTMSAAKSEYVVNVDGEDYTVTVELGDKRTLGNNLVPYLGID